MIIGTLQSRILEDHAINETGNFSLDVNVDEAVMQRSGDVFSYATATISAYLASSIIETQVPVEYWSFITSERMIRRYNFPGAINFGVTG